MFPTNRLRQVPIYRIITHNIRESTPTGYKLQQWWSLSGASPEFIAQLNYPPDHEGWRDRGEWRDVEIVEE